MSWPGIDDHPASRDGAAPFAGQPCSKRPLRHAFLQVDSRQLRHRLQGSRVVVMHILVHRPTLTQNFRNVGEGGFTKSDLGVGGSRHLVSLTTGRSTLLGGQRPDREKGLYRSAESAAIPEIGEPQSEVRTPGASPVLPTACRILPWPALLSRHRVFAEPWRMLPCPARLEQFCSIPRQSAPSGRRPVSGARFSGRDRPDAPARWRRSPYGSTPWSGSLPPDR